jgi:membrane carboxypeptidase/penicillin-binding protein
MDSILVKIFATALAFSQVTVEPDNIRTEFDPVQDQQQVVSLLRAGCAHMRKAFDIEDLNIDDLIATAMDDPEAVSGGLPQFRGMNIGDLHTAYRQFCRNETVANSPVDIAAVIEFYNHTLRDLPDHTRLRGLRLPGASVVLDHRGQKFAEVFEQDQRRVWVPIADIPAHVQAAFIAAEDKRFREHRGVDERGLIRAFIGNLTQSGRLQGGSTITQQLVKNLLVGDDLSYERKIREMILAARVERLLTKDEILELYLNSVFLGRSSWGIELASRSYFGKAAGQLTLPEGAMLAGLTKGPNFFNPDRHPQRVRDRFSYVLGRMVEDNALPAEEMKQTVAIGLPQMVAFERPRRDTGFYFTDHIAREAKAVVGMGGLTTQTYTVRSSINAQVQRAAEAALQEGLARYETHTNRVANPPAEANLGDAIRRIEAAKQETGTRPAWQQALAAARLPLYDVHWPYAVVVENARGQIKVGLSDGRIVPLTGPRSAMGKLRLYDVVFVRLGETRTAKGKSAVSRAELRVRPTVQGAVVVLENQTGRILAMAGGFSYPLSQLNRVTQSQRQPGSAIKPISYLAALAQGLQPNTLLRDEPLVFAPVDGSVRARPEDYWQPKNYDGGAGGIITLRRALENSRNLATASLLQGGIDITPALSLDRICALALEAQIYRECMRYYPFVLGAQPVRPIDLAAFFASVANEGTRPTPHAIVSVEQGGKTIYRHPEETIRIGSADGVAFYQLKAILQGVLARGTAARIAALAPYVAGKTGTTDNENDAWFVGFSNEVTVAVWVGYDNADGRRRTLGGGATGGSVAVPIFEPVMQAVWAHHAPKTLLRGPSAETRKHLVTTRVDSHTGGIAGNEPGERGERDRGGGGLLVEYLRRDARGRVVDTQYRLVARGEALFDDPYGRRDDRFGFGDFFGRGGFAPWGGAPQQPSFNPPPPVGGRGIPQRPAWGPPLWGTPRD